MRLKSDSMTPKQSDSMTPKQLLHCVSVQVRSRGIKMLQEAIDWLGNSELHSAITVKCVEALLRQFHH